MWESKKKKGMTWRTFEGSDSIDSIGNPQKKFWFQATDTFPHLEFQPVNCSASTPACAAAPAPPEGDGGLFVRGKPAFFDDTKGYPTKYPIDHIINPLLTAYHINIINYHCSKKYWTMAFPVKKPLVFPLASLGKSSPEVGMEASTAPGGVGASVFGQKYAEDHDRKWWNWDELIIFLGNIRNFFYELMVNLVNLSPTIPSQPAHDTFQGVATSHDPPWTEASLRKGMGSERDP